MGYYYLNLFEINIVKRFTLYMYSNILYLTVREWPKPQIKRDKTMSKLTATFEQVKKIADENNIRIELDEDGDIGILTNAEGCKYSDSIQFNELRVNQSLMSESEEVLLDKLNAKILKRLLFAIKPSARQQAVSTSKNGYTLKDYIRKYFSGSQRAFAESQGVQPAQVTQWLSKEFIVVDHVLHSPRRELNH